VDDDGVSIVARQAVGAELRVVRETLRWTRDDLKKRLPFDIHVRTLAGYENGSIQCMMSRFVTLCETMGVSAPDVLAWALQRAEIGLPTTGIQVDLRAIVADKTPELRPLRSWARKRLNDDLADIGVARLQWPAVQEMATLFGMQRAKFVTCLVRYTPEPVPQRR
jgi:hypothetical protein